MAEYEGTPPPDRLADRVQLRTAFSTGRGLVTRFLVQLEYWLGGEWYEIVRYDHDLERQSGHDVTEEGLHRDVFRGGEKFRTESVSDPVPANEAFDYAEDDLRENAERVVRRFERWHGVREPTDP